MWGIFLGIVLDYPSKSAFHFSAPRPVLTAEKADQDVSRPWSWLTVEVIKGSYVHYTKGLENGEFRVFFPWFFSCQVSMGWLYALHKGP